MALQGGDLVHHLGDRPFGGARQNPGDEEDGDGADDARQPLDGLILPVGAFGISLVHRHSPLNDVDDTSCAATERNETGRESCRERVYQYGSISVVAVSLKKKKKQ